MTNIMFRKGLAFGIMNEILNNQWAKSERLFKTITMEEWRKYGGK